MLLIGSRIVTSSTPDLGRAATRGWCPGVLDPMETGDGWLLRIRLPGGVIDVSKLRVVGAVAAEHGSGQVDITSRGNLQIRGVSADRVELAGDELVHARLTLPDALAAQRVPTLLLQPLVENAVKHGLEPHVQGGRVDVSAANEDGQLVLRVRDTGAGLARAAPQAGSGFGLVQVRERLAALYGPAASLELAPAPDAEDGTLATLRLPL